jgi:hypothetical protein
LVNDSEDHRDVWLFEREVNGVGKFGEQGASDGLLDEWELQRVLDDTFKDSGEFLDEARREKYVELKVPGYRIADVSVGFGTDNDLNHGSSSSRKSSFEVSAHVGPWTPCGRIASKGGKAFLDQRTVPVGNGNRRGCDDGVPKRFDVSDLLIDGQVVETRRRIGQWLGHKVRLALRWKSRNARSVELEYARASKPTVRFGVTTEILRNGRRLSRHRELSGVVRQ